MKPKTTRIPFLFGCGSSLLAAVSALVSLPNANAAEYWWNQNDTTSGWEAGANGGPRQARLEYRLTEQAKCALEIIERP